jgi:hypothetical protein
MNLRSCKQKNNRERGCRRALPFFLQGLQRGNVLWFGKDLKGDFCSFSCELSLFLGGGRVLNDVFCGFYPLRFARPPKTGGQ